MPPMFKTAEEFDAARLAVMARCGGPACAGCGESELATLSLYRVSRIPRPGGWSVIRGAVVHPAQYAGIGDGRSAYGHRVLCANCNARATRGVALPLERRGFAAAHFKVSADTLVFFCDLNHDNKLYVGTEAQLNHLADAEGGSPRRVVPGSIRFRASGRVSFQYADYLGDKISVPDAAFGVAPPRWTPSGPVVDPRDLLIADLYDLARRAADLDDRNDAIARARKHLDTLLTRGARSTPATDGPNPERSATWA